MVNADSQPTFLTFGSFRLDAANARLWHGTQPVRLKPKAFAVLCHLVERPGQLIRKEDFLEALWPDAIVSEGVLKSCVREIREALGEQARTPQFIETVHRRGYRFIGRMQLQQANEDHPTSLHRYSPPIVGRAAELIQLRQWFAKALKGERQLIFVTGEAGIGKTTLLEAFCAELMQRSAPWIGVGQCIEQYGTGEPYLPVLEAFGRVCRQADGCRVIAILRQYAPTWLAQMPALLSAPEVAALRRQGQATTRDRMLREMADALEVLSADRPLVLVLEDLHWSDPSTLELLAALAHRQEPARLMVIGTYRPIDTIVHTHPLRTVQRELQLHGQCKELLLDYLSEAAIREYLTLRFADASIPHDMLSLLHRRTDGNPLFLVNVVENLLEQGIVTAADTQWDLPAVRETMRRSVPETLRRFIVERLHQMTEQERLVLETASIIGTTFPVALVAKSMEQSEEVVEDCCAALARRQQFLQVAECMSWPDGAVSSQYHFIHTLYQEIVYGQMSPGQRRRRHHRIGALLETFSGNCVSEMAAELAVHFTQGQDWRRAVQYLSTAGGNALRRHGYQEAIVLLTQGLALLRTAPSSASRNQQEIELQLSLGPALLACKGHAASEVEQAYARAHELCQESENNSSLFPALWGLMACAAVRAELPRAHALGEQLLQLAQQQQEPALLLEAHIARGSTSLWLGELALARTHFVYGVELYHSQRYQDHTYLYGLDPGVVVHANASYALWLLGHADQALTRSQEAVACAQQGAHPFSLAYALNWASMLFQLRGDAAQAYAWGDRAMTLSLEQGFTHLLAVATLLRGAVMVRPGQVEAGLTHMRESVTTWRNTGAALQQPYYLSLLAGACAETGSLKEEEALLEEALACIQRTEERWWEAEVHRLWGELCLQQGAQGEKHKQRSKSATKAEEYFYRAQTIARQQGAKSLELRVAISWSRVLQRQGKREAARQMLAQSYDWFTEGFTTKDLQEAKALLAQLA